MAEPLSEEAINKAAVASRHALWDDWTFQGFSSESDAQDYGFQEGVKWAQEQLAVAQPVDMPGTYMVGTEEEALRSHERREAMKEPVVSTVEEVKALPDDSVILDDGGTVMRKWHGDSWYATSDDYAYTDGHVALPARVLWNPAVNDA